MDTARVIEFARWVGNQATSHQDAFFGAALSWIGAKIAYRWTMRRGKLLLVDATITLTDLRYELIYDKSLPNGHENVCAMSVKVTGKLWSTFPVPISFVVQSLELCRRNRYLRTQVRLLVWSANACKIEDAERSDGNLSPNTHLRFEMSMMRGEGVQNGFTRLIADWDYVRVTVLVLPNRRIHLWCKLSDAERDKVLKSPLVVLSTAAKRRLMG